MGVCVCVGGGGVGVCMCMAIKFSQIIHEFLWANIPVIEYVNPPLI